MTEDGRLMVCEGRCNPGLASVLARVPVAETRRVSDGDRDVIQPITGVIVPDLRALRHMPHEPTHDGRWFCLVCGTERR